MTFSVLARRKVSLWSEEWKHACEIRYLAGMTLTQRNETLDDVKDGLRGLQAFAADKAVAHLRAEIDRYAALKVKG